MLKGLKTDVQRHGLFSQAAEMSLVARLPFPACAANPVQVSPCVHLVLSATLFRVRILRACDESPLLTFCCQVTRFYAFSFLPLFNAVPVTRSPKCWPLRRYSTYSSSQHRYSLSAGASSTSAIRRQPTHKSCGSSRTRSISSSPTSSSMKSTAPSTAPA